MESAFRCEALVCGVVGKLIVLKCVCFQCVAILVNYVAAVGGCWEGNCESHLSFDDLHESEESQHEKSDAEGENEGLSFQDVKVCEVAVLPDDVGWIGCITHAFCVKLLTAKDDKVSIDLLFSGNIIVFLIVF